jgi:hypothetical protein
MQSRMRASAWLRRRSSEDWSKPSCCSTSPCGCGDGPVEIWVARASGSHPHVISTSPDGDYKPDWGSREEDESDEQDDD